jgi:hypothetical protein
MTAAASQPARDSFPDLHLATIAHEGLIWDAYIEFDDDPQRSVGFRARLRFNPPSVDQGPQATRTTVIIIEDSYEDAVAKARNFDDRSLQALLRSALP